MISDLVYELAQQAARIFEGSQLRRVTWKAQVLCCMWNLRFLFEVKALGKKRQKKMVFFEVPEFIWFSKKIENVKLNDLIRLNRINLFFTLLSLHPL